MKRKDYMKPAMQVVELQHRTMLLQYGSPEPQNRSVRSRSSIRNWEPAETTEEDIYM